MGNRITWTFVDNFQTSLNRFSQYLPSTSSNCTDLSCTSFHCKLQRELKFLKISCRKKGKPNIVWPARSHALEEFKIINKHLLSFFFFRKKKSNRWRCFENIIITMHSMYSSSPVPKDTLSEPPIRCSSESPGRHYQSGKQNTKPRNIAKTNHGASSCKDMLAG